MQKTKIYRRIGLHSAPKRLRTRSTQDPDITENAAAIVVAWPNYSESNPYQPLLYSRNAFGAHYYYGPLVRAIDLLKSNMTDAPVIFHLHWLNWLFLNIHDAQEAHRAVTAFIARLRYFQQLGGLVVWTIHNELSHESPFPEEERALSTEIARLADCIHVHDIGSLDEIKEFEVPRHKVVELPHGHYRGAYSDAVSRSEARGLLGFTELDEVYLIFGMLREYKGSRELIDGFRRLLRSRPNAKLLLVGRMPFDPFDHLEEPLTDAERRAIHVHKGFVKDDTVQIFFRASDFGILPYRKVLTSGTVMLGLTFDLPFAATDTAMIRSVLTSERFGTLISNPDAEQIYAAMQDLAERRSQGQLGLTEDDRADFAERYRWRDFSEEVVRPLVERAERPQTTGLRAHLIGQSLPGWMQFEDYEIVATSPQFTADQFADSYPTISASARDPAAAYLEHARTCNVKPNAKFDPAFFQSFFSDASTSHMNPFIHYLKFGVDWKRPANAHDQLEMLRDFKSGFAVKDDDSSAIQLCLLGPADMEGFDRFQAVIEAALGEPRVLCLHAVYLEDDPLVEPTRHLFSAEIADGRLHLDIRTEGSGSRLFAAIESARNIRTGGPVVFIDPAAGNGEVVPVLDQLTCVLSAPQLPFVYLAKPDDVHGHLFSITRDLLIRVAPACPPLNPELLPNLIAARARQACQAVPIAGPVAADPMLGMSDAVSWTLAKSGISDVDGSVNVQLFRLPLEETTREAFSQVFDLTDALVEGGSTWKVRREISDENVLARVAYVAKQHEDVGLDEHFEVLSGPARRIAGPDDTVVFSCMKDDNFFVPAFLEHYRALGARHIVLVDNHSSEQIAGTTPSPDLTVVRPKHGRFLTSKTLWLELLMQQFSCPGGWLLTVDADELLDLPQGIAGFQHLSQALLETGSYFLPCLMLDMLPGAFDGKSNTPLEEADFTGILDHICWVQEPVPHSYRTDNTVKWGFGDHAQLSWQVDSRHHLFGVNESLRKFSFLQNRPGLHLNQGFHSLLGPTGSNMVTDRVWEADLVGYLRHYKFAKFVLRNHRGAGQMATGAYHEKTTENLNRILANAPEDIIAKIVRIPRIRYSPALMDSFLKTVGQARGSRIAPGSRVT